MDWHGDVIDWGSVPAWVGGILTGASFWLGFTILRRDKRKAQRAHAEQLVCWLDPDPREYNHKLFQWNEHEPVTLHLSNTSNSPVIRVCMVTYLDRKQKDGILAWEKANPKLNRWNNQMVSGRATSPIGDRDKSFALTGGVDVSMSVPNVDRPLRFMKIWVTFYDSNGKQWARYVPNQKLYPYSRRRVYDDGWLHAFGTNRDLRRLNKARNSKSDQPLPPEEDES